MSEPEYVEQQRLVQRLFGRCMLRLQQYEKLLKILLAKQQLSGPIHELAPRQAARDAAVANDTLGKLVNAFVGAYYVTDGTPPTSGDEARTSSQAIEVDIRIQLESTNSQVSQISKTLGELVQLRNDLAHHFLDRFEIWSTEGCAAAVRHLNDCYVLIDERYTELLGVAKDMEAMRQEMFAVLQSDIVLDLVADGIEPDGKVDWRRAGIVRALKAAEKSLAINSWTPLEAAANWIASNFPDQVPAKYGCRSWRQVVNDSRQFELVYRPSESGRRNAWYRLRANRRGAS